MTSQYIATAFRALLRLYPAEFRDEYGREMAIVLSDRYREAVSSWQRLLISLETIAGVLSHAPKEHSHMMLRDLRYALRVLRQSPLFTFTAILSLATGIGANIAIFAVAKNVLFETLPVKDPQQLRLLTWVSSGHEQPVPPVWGDVYATKEGGLASTAFSYPVLEEFRKQSEVFQDLIAFKDVEITATVDGHPELVAGEMLSGGAFNALGVPPILGRALTADDDSGPGSAPAAMIAEGYWADRFGRSDSILGKIISLNGTSVSIVGVAPARFTGLTTGSIARVFVPLTLQPLLLPRAQTIGSGNPSLLENPQSWWVSIMARLRNRVPESRIQTVLDLALRRTAIATLPEAKNLERFHLKLQPGDRGLDYLTGLAKPSYVLLTFSGLVLLLACVNLATLLLARAANRQREMSTRLALGAGRASILHQLLTESLLLSSIGGIVGFSVAYLARNVIPRMLTNSWRTPNMRADFNWKVLSFAIAVSLLTGLVFGAVPVWQAMRTDVSTALKDASRGTAGRRKILLGRGLVALQVALSTILLIAAGLFVKTLLNLSHSPLGFRADHMLLFKINPPRTRYTDRQMIALYAQMEGKLATISGVRSVTLSNIALIGDGHSGSTFQVTGQPVPGKQDRVQTNSVGADFFQTMGIPILQGRGFNPHHNATSPRVAVINRALARRYFPNENPIGKTFESEDAAGLVEITGIAADSKYADLRSETPPTFYTPYWQRNLAGRMIVEIRTVTNPFSVLGPVRATVESLDRDLPLIEVRTQEQQIEASLSSERIFAQLTSAFGLLALALASVGTYGLMAYSVTRRSGEIGIRMALGARVDQVLAAVLREAMSIALAGIALGIVASFGLARWIGAMLYGLKTVEPAVIGGTAALLICVTLLAAMGPARRASRLDPSDVLRHD